MQHRIARSYPSRRDETMIERPVDIYFDTLKDKAFRFEVVWINERGIRRSEQFCLLYEAIERQAEALEAIRAEVEAAGVASAEDA